MKLKYLGTGYIWGNHAKEVDITGIKWWDVESNRGINGFEGSLCFTVEERILSRQNYEKNVKTHV